MKSEMVLAWILMTLCALPAYALEGTIEETETAIIVEYTGEATKLPATPVGGQLLKAVPQSTQPVELPTQAANPEAVQQVPPAKTDMSAQEARANQTEAQRKSPSFSIFTCLPNQSD
jgi:hypothetical protein